jgi:hypothetical protein
MQPGGEGWQEFVELAPFGHKIEFEQWRVYPHYRSGCPVEFELGIGHRD